MEHEREKRGHEELMREIYFFLDDFTFYTSSSHTVSKRGGVSYTQRIGIGF
jgi:hypothetical protein